MNFNVSKCLFFWRVFTSPSGYGFPVYSLRQGIQQFPSLSAAPPHPHQGFTPSNFKVATLHGYAVIPFMCFSTFTGFNPLSFQ